MDGSCYVSGLCEQTMNFQFNISNNIIENNLQITLSKLNTINRKYIENLGLVFGQCWQSCRNLKSHIVLKLLMHILYTVYKTLYKKKYSYLIAEMTKIFRR